MKISTVINTYNEESNIKRCLESVQKFSEEIVVVDMHSTDKTIDIVKRFTDKIYFHDYTRYVEPARNFAISKATGDWVLLIDADEELTKTLTDELRRVAQQDKASYVEIPRKNIIFGKWIENSRWWPDYNIRFFRQGSVLFSEKIHRPPTTKGNGVKLEAKEVMAIEHNHYVSISQYIERLNRYSDIQVEDRLEDGYRFKWQDIIIKPFNEFLSRFYFGKGYRDGLHGLVLALLQSFTELTIYLKIWEKSGFQPDKITKVDELITQQFNNFLHWRIKSSHSLIEKYRLKIKRRL